MKKQVLGNIIVLFALSWIYVGCATPTPKKEDELLQTAKQIHAEVAGVQGNPQENYLRKDWLPVHYKILEDGYLYATPYFPYLFYDVLLNYFKEGGLIWISPVMGGTKYQDQADSWQAQNSLQYKKLFHSMWAKERTHANYLNMDHWTEIELATFPVPTK